jgi:hypothetical protein
MLSPGPRQHRRCQAGNPVIDLSEFPESLLIPMHVQRDVWAMRNGYNHTARTDERSRPQDARPTN